MRTQFWNGGRVTDQIDHALFLGRRKGGRCVFVGGRLLLIRVTAGESVFRKRVFFFLVFPNPADNPVDESFMLVESRAKENLVFPLGVISKFFCITFSPFSLMSYQKPLSLSPLKKNTRKLSTSLFNKK